jgi:hypothetical protein
MKTLSHFLLNPFTTSVEPPSSRESFPIPSAPMPLHATLKSQGLIDTSLPLTTGSPFRVYLRDVEREQGMPITGLPGSHYPLAALSGGEQPGGLRTGSVEKTIWKELPTLASAIHIDDHTPSASKMFGMSQPLPKPAGLSKPEPNLPSGNTTQAFIPRNTSNGSSFFETYRNKSLRRSSSKSSVRGSISEVDSKPSQATLGRRMSRRLSFDNIKPMFNGGMRKKDRAVSATEPDSWRPQSEMSHTKPLAEVFLPPQLPGKPSRMVLPPMRGLRARLTGVSGSGNAAIMTTAKADVKARLKAKKAKREEVEMASVRSVAAISVSPNGTLASDEGMRERKRLPDWDNHTSGERNERQVSRVDST